MSALIEVRLASILSEYNFRYPVLSKLSDVCCFIQNLGRSLAKIYLSQDHCSVFNFSIILPVRFVYGLKQDSFQTVPDAYLAIKYLRIPTPKRNKASTQILPSLRRHWSTGETIRLYVHLINFVLKMKFHGCVIYFYYWNRI